MVIKAIKEPEKKTHEKDGCTCKRINGTQQCDCSEKTNISDGVDKNITVTNQTIAIKNAL